VGGGGAGVHALSSRSRIEANNVVANDRGIHVDSPGNVIVTNTARDNLVNYEIALNNVFGAIVDQTAPVSAPVNGNNAPSSVGTTDPWANISY
jgi:parallel beta-helix repeat protein